MLAQAENKIVIEGILSEVNIKSGEFMNRTTQQMMPYYTGSIKVRVSQEINGVNEDMEVPVYCFASKYTSKGNENPAYKSISDVVNNFTSIAAGGIERASRIRITSASIRENAFYGQDGKLISAPRIESSFFQKIGSDVCAPKATFKNTICIGNIREEVDKSGEVTGRLIVQGIIPQYGGKVDVVNFVVGSRDAVDHIQNYWNKGDTVNIVGKLNFSSRTEYVEEAMGFGEPVRTAKTINIHELIITSGSAGCLEGDLAYDTAEIAEALQARQVRLEELKNKSKEKPAAKPKDQFADLGF